MARRQAGGRGTYLPTGGSGVIEADPRTQTLISRAAIQNCDLDNVKFTVFNWRGVIKNGIKL